MLNAAVLAAATPPTTTANGARTSRLRLCLLDLTLWSSQKHGTGNCALQLHCSTCTPSWRTYAYAAMHMKDAPGALSPGPRHAESVAMDSPEAAQPPAAARGRGRRGGPPPPPPAAAGIANGSAMFTGGSGRGARRASTGVRQPGRGAGGAAGSGSLAGVVLQSAQALVRRRVCWPRRCVVRCACCAGIRQGAASSGAPPPAGCALQASCAADAAKTAAEHQVQHEDLTTHQEM